MEAITTDPRVVAVIDSIERRDYRAGLDAIQSELSSSDSDLSIDQRQVLEILSGECLAFLGQYHEAIASCEPAVQRLRRGSNHALFGRACFAMAVAHYFLGDTDKATGYANSAYHAFQRAEDRLGAVKTLNWLGNITFDKSEFRHALDLYRECAEMARTYGQRRWAAVAEFNTGLPLLMLGHLDEAHEALVRSRKILSEYPDRLNLIRLDLATVYVLMQKRNLEEAAVQLVRVKEDVFTHAHLREQGIWYEYKGELELHCGNYDDAIAALNRAIAIGEQSGPDESLIGQSQRLMAEVLLAQGDPEAALAEAERALASIRKVGERVEEGAVLRIVGLSLAACGRADDAGDAFRQSVGILQMLGARFELAQTCVAAGCSSAVGNLERLGHLFEAERVFTEIGVSYWTTVTKSALENALGESRKPAHASPVKGVSGEGPVFVTVHPATRETLGMAEVWAGESAAILITGETGTGKDLLARYIHSVGTRRDQPFVEIDLNNIPATLWESELFGHRKGVFTGASGERTGVLAAVDGGTVFLNEIGNLPLDMQMKLLDFLETRRYRRLGEQQQVELDIQVIAATNENLREAMEQKRFRADLYYRLEQAPLHLLPLRERREDILPLTRHFLKSFGMDPKIVQGLSDQPWVRRLVAGEWEGNARQLRSFLWRLVSLTGTSPNGNLATWADTLLDRVYQSSAVSPAAGADERHRLVAALKRHDWNQRATARELKLSEGTVRHRMRKWSIARPVN